MNRKKGIRLTAESDRTSVWLLQGLLAALLSCTVLFTVFEGCGLHCTMALISAAAACIAWAVLRYFGKEQFFSPGLLLLLLITALAFGTAITDGACIAWNRSGYTYTAATARVLPLLSSSGTKESLAFNLFSAVLGAVTALIALPAVKKARALAAISLPLLLLLIRLLMKNGSALSTGLCLGAAVLLLLSSGWEQEKEAVKALIGGGVLTAMIIGVLYLGCRIPFVKHWTEDVAKNTERSIAAVRYETEHSYLPQGDFTEYKNKSIQGYTALAVAMEQPERIFLRGFVGDRFEDDVWTATENAVLAENRELLYWLQKEHFYSQNQLSAAAEGLDAESGRISIQNFNASSKYIYLPYTVIQDSLPLLHENRLSPSALLAEGWKGQRNYSYQVVKDSRKQTAAALVELQESESEAVKSFLQAEAAYREFINANELQLPESFVKLMGETLDNFCRSYGGREDLGLNEAQAAALDFLEYCFAEDSRITLPLTQAQGSSYQYATVAALALRYYGIPARYAEGYEITAEMAEAAAAGENILVGTEMGKAWVEIYQQGIGWMPMDQTPGMEALAGRQSESGYKPVGIDGIDPNSQMGSAEGEGTAVPLTQGREQDNETADKDDTDGFLTGGGTMVFIRKLIRWTAILIALAALLLVALIIFRRFWLLRKKRQRFMQPDCREAVGWIYADAARMLSEMGMDRNGGSMESVCLMAEELSADYGSMCRAMTELNGRALFSSKAMSERERRDMLLFRSESLCWLKERVKWYRKLWLRWGLCLY